MSLTKADTKNLREYFSVSGDGFFIPDYQRDYSWGDDELSDFWEDLEKSKDEEYHFFGQIVIHNDSVNKQKFIIDGQQRTITTVICLAVIKMLFDELAKKCDSDDEEESKIKDDAEDCYQEIRAIIKKRQKGAVSLGAADKDFFYKYIIKGDAFKKGKEKRKSQTNIKKAYDFFYQKIKTRIVSLPLAEEYEIYKEYYTSLIEKFQVLYVEATELEEAFDIFETLNAKGKNLEASDLLKNYFLSKLHNDKKCKEDWDYIDEKVGSDNKTEYIRCFINSKGTFSSKKGLYRHIKKDIAPHEKECRKLLKELRQYSEDYRFISNPISDDLYENEELVKSLSALKVFRAKTFYPIVLSMKQRKYGENDIKLVVNKIESLVFRNIKICGYNPNIYEKEFAKLALCIFNSRSEKIAGKICEEIDKLMVSDKDFKTKFAGLALGENNDELIRYIFRKIHYYLDVNHEINCDNNVVHIEHIMPKEASKWNVKDEEHKELLWRIGNLALLAEKLNKKNSNKPFLDKKPFFKKSKIEPNKEIAAFKKWDRASIDSRQKKLAGYAVEIWKKSK